MKPFLHSQLPGWSVAWAVPTAPRAGPYNSVRSLTYRVHGIFLEGKAIIIPNNLQQNLGWVAKYAKGSHSIIGVGVGPCPCLPTPTSYYGPYILLSPFCLLRTPCKLGTAQPNPLAALVRISADPISYGLVLIHSLWVKAHTPSPSTLLPASLHFWAHP